MASGGDGSGGGFSTAPLRGSLPECGPERPPQMPPQTKSGGGMAEAIAQAGLPRSFTGSQWDQVKQEIKGNVPRVGTLSERDLVSSAGSMAAQHGIPAKSVEHLYRNDKQVSAAFDLEKAAVGELNAGGTPAQRRVARPGESCVISDPLVSSVSPPPGGSNVLNAWGRLASPGRSMVAPVGPSVSMDRGAGIGMG